MHHGRSGAPPRSGEVVVGRRAVIGGSVAAIVLLNVANAWSIGLGADTPGSRYFLMALERNPSTWFGASLLAGTGTLALAVGRGRPDVSSWNLVGGVLWLMSLDEVATFHERLSALPVVPGIGSRGWAGAGLLLAALVGARLLRWVLALEPPLRFALIAGGALFVGGAVGLEVVSGDRRVAHGTDLVYWTLATVEENLEMLGVLIVARALLDHLADSGQRLTIRVR